MITHLSGHWDKLPDGTASYPRGMLKGFNSDQLKEETRTIFIKLDINTGEANSAWEGNVSRFSFSQKKLSFRVNLKKKITVPQKYKDYGIGWYID